MFRMNDLSFEGINSPQAEYRSPATDAQQGETFVAASRTDLIALRLSFCERIRRDSLRRRRGDLVQAPSRPAGEIG
jgi:hypothetical protein